MEVPLAFLFYGKYYEDVTYENKFDHVCLD